MTEKTLLGTSKATVTTRRTCFCVLSTCKNMGKRRASVRGEYRLRSESYGSGSTQTRRRTLSACKTFSTCGLRIHHPCVRVRATRVPRTCRAEEARVRLHVSRHAPRLALDVFFSLSRNLTSVIMSGEQHLSETSSTGATPADQHQTDYQARADEDESTSDHTYEAMPAIEAFDNGFRTGPYRKVRPGPEPVIERYRGPGETPKPQSHLRTPLRATPADQHQTDYQEGADDDESTSDHTYEAMPESAPMPKPQSDWTAVADAAAKIPNPMYASNKGSTPADQHQTDYQARADNDESTSDPTNSTIQGKTEWNELEPGAVEAGSLAQFKSELARTLLH
ncbi:hypothetical protein Bbelb_040210 [Branchiostoma belcheri]|nr:hypothetical protein Bbelb_040210 [Branchiostoma belcheri]